MYSVLESNTCYRKKNSSEGIQNTLRVRLRGLQCKIVIRESLRRWLCPSSSGDPLVLLSSLIPHILHLKRPTYGVNQQFPCHLAPFGFTIVNPSKILEGGRRVRSRYLFLGYHLVRIFWLTVSLYWKFDSSQGCWLCKILFFCLQ